MLEACNAYSGARGTFRLQHKAFENSLKALKDHWKDGIEIAVYPVAGFGTSFDDFVLIPLDPQTLEEETELPLFHKHTWSAEFGEVFGTFQNTIKVHEKLYRGYHSTHGNKLHMYGLELRGRRWQISWISRALKDPSLKSFVKKNLRLNRSNLGYAEYFRGYLEKMGLLNVASTALNKAHEMSECFSEPEPRVHYPHL